jgi:YidC/Oxa1 family membrane protein insertase
VAAAPGDDPATGKGSLRFLEEVAPGLPGALAVSLHAGSVDFLPLETRQWEDATAPGAPAAVYRVRALAKEKAAGRGVTVEKRFLPAEGADDWHLRMEVTIRNDEPDIAGFPFRLQVRGPALVRVGDPTRDLLYGRVKVRKVSSPKNVMGPEAAEAEKEREPRTVDGDIEWTGVASTYFCALLDPAEPPEGDPLPALRVRWEGLAPPAPAPGAPRPAPQPSPVLSLEAGLPAPGAARTWAFTFYVGPTADGIPGPAGGTLAVLDRPEYAPYKPVRDPGMFDAIGRGLFWILRAFHSIVPNWGVAIILLTVLVRGCLFPLSRKSMQSTIEYGKKMQKIKPKLEALKEKYGDDRGRYGQEQMKLMKEHGVPLMPGGCLLTFLQLPIWIALYSMLQYTFELRHATFLWVDDLSQADHLWHMLPSVASIPLVPNALEWLNLLPLLMTASWFFSSKATMTPPADEQQAQMQAMMQWMPFVMLLFPGFYTMPAGLCLYITASSTWGIVESRLIRKSLGA